MYDTPQLADILATEPTTRDRIGEPKPFGSGKYRDIESTWEVGPGQLHPDSSIPGEEGTIVLDLTTYHHGKAEYYGQLEKCYTSTIRVAFVGENFKQTTLSFGTKNESVRVLNVPVERFSAKSMREAHQKALAYVRENPNQIAPFIHGGVQQYVAKEVNA
jgi:hypothetical protein